MTTDDRGETLQSLRVFGHSRDILAGYLQSGQLTDPARQFLAEDDLVFLERAREGYRWAVRAPDWTIEELRRTVRPLDLPVTDPFEPPGAWRLLVPSRQVYLATNVAQIVFGWMPRVPAEAVTFPNWMHRSYADIIPPSTPSEFFARIADLESLIWAVATGLGSSALSSLRRAYAFFETGSWLNQQFRPKPSR